MPPSVFIVPGFYEGPEVFEPLATILRHQGFPAVHITSLKSTGTQPPGNPTMDDDISAIAAELTSVVEEAGADGVLAVMHSAGGALGSAAMKGLTVAARKSDGKPGGVFKIVFVTAGIFPEETEAGPLPFMEFNESSGTQSCRDPLNMLFHDLPSAEAERWAGKVQHQPAIGWGTKLSYCGWREVPSVYVVCEADRLLSVEVQEHLASLAGSELVRLEGAGHMVQLSRPDDLAKIIARAAES